MLKRNLSLRKKFALSTLIASCFTFAPPAAHAATYYWDNNGTTAGFGTAGGTWADPTLNQWNTDSTGVTAPGASITTLNTNNTTDGLNFGTATDGLAAGTITVTGTVASGNMTYGAASGQIVLSGGTINLAAGSVLTNNSAVTNTISSILGGTTVTKAGTGGLVFSGPNTYTGLTTISAGVLNIQNATALGTTATGTTVTSGAALQIQGGITVGAEALTLNGTGIATNGALRNISGNNNYGGLITLASPTRIQSDAGTLTISNTGTITGPTFGLTVGGAGNTQINSIIGTTTGGLTKDGAGTLTLQGNNTFTGNFTLTAGKVIATNNNNSMGQGTLMLNGGTLQLARTASQTWGRPAVIGGNVEIISDTNAALVGVTHTLTTLSIGASTLTVSGGTAATSGTQGLTFGATTLTGAPTFTVNNQGAIPTLLTTGTLGLAANTLTKTGNGSMTASGAISGTKAAGSNALVINDGVFTAGANGTFTGNIAVDGTGVFAMAGATYTTVAPYGAAGNLYKQLLLTNGGTFRLNSGTFNNNVPNATNVAAGIIFNIGSGGGTLDVASGAQLTIDDGTGTGTAAAASQLQGSGTLTKTGLGTLQQDDSTAFAGDIIIAAGTFQPASANAGGSAAAGTTILSGARYNVNGVTLTNLEPLTINGTGLAASPVGALTNASATAGTYAGPVTLGSAATIGASGTGQLNINGAVDLGTNTLTMLNANTSRIQIAGVISGTGALVLNSTSTGDVNLTAANTYSGGTTMNAGSRVPIGTNFSGPAGAPTAGPFGTGVLNLNGGLLRSGTGGSFAVGNSILLSADSGFYTIAGENTLVFSGPMTIAGTGVNRALDSTVGTTVAGRTVRFDGVIGDAGNNNGLTKTGLGNLTLGGANTYTGGTTVSAGTLQVTGSLANNTALTVAGGAGLNLLSGAANGLGSISALSLGTGSGTTSVALELGANTAASDLLATPNAATTANSVGLAIFALPGFGTAATYDLITAPSGLSGATYALTNVPGGYSYTLLSSDTFVRLGVTAAPAGTVYWNGGVNSSWSALSGANTNFTTDAAGTTNAGFNPSATNSVVFSAANAVGPTFSTTLDNIFSVNDVQFTASPTGVTAVSIAPGASLGTPNSLTISPALATSGLSVASDAGAVTISAPVVLGANQTWNVDGSGANGSSLTVSGGVSGSGTLTLASANGGIVTISGPAGSSTYNGQTNVPSGTTFQGGAANSFSANSVVNVTGTGLVELNGFSNTVANITGNGTIQNGHPATAATLTFGDATNTTFSGSIINGDVGTLAIAKTGTGTAILSGTNTYTGATTVNAGTLAAGSATTFGLAGIGNGTLALAGTSTFDLNGFNAAVTNISASPVGTTITNSGTSDATLAVSTHSSTISSLISDGSTNKLAVTLRNNNLGTTAFLLTSPNTYSGGLTLVDGSALGAGTRLRITGAVATVGSPGAITSSPFGTGTISIGQAATDKAGILFDTTANVTLVNDVTFNTSLGTDRFGIRSDVGGIIMSGLVTANSDAVFSSNNSANAPTITLTNKVTGVGGLAIDLSQTTTANTVLTVTLNATPGLNDYQGDTVVGRTNASPAQNYAATLTLGAADQIPNGSGKGNLVLIDNSATRTGTLNLNGFNETVNGLKGNGSVDATSGTSILTIGDNNATNNNFSGALKNSGGSLTLTKIGTGTQILSGSNSYSGGTNVNAGTLVAQNAAALGTGNVTAASGANLSYFAAADSQLIIGGSLNVTGGSGTTIGASIGSGSESAAINVLGTATISDAAHMINIYGVSGVTKNTGLTTLIRGGVGSALNPTTAPTLGLLYNNTDFTLNLTAGDGGTPFTRLSDSISVTVVPVTALTDAYWRGGQVTGNLGSMAVSNGATSNWASDAGGTATSLTPGSTANVFFSTTTGATQQANVVLGANMSVNSVTFNDTTPVTINPDGYALTLNSTGTGALSALNVNQNATINADLIAGVGQTWTVAASKSLSVGGVISGAGTIAKDGPGSLTLTGSNTFTGQLSVLDGNLVVNSINNVNSNGTLGNSAGSVILGGTATTGTLEYTGATATANKPLTIATSGTGGIQVNNAATNLTLSGVIDGGGVLAKSGPGLLILTGNNTYSGGTTVAAGGSLQATINAGTPLNALGTGNVSIAAGSTVTLNNVKTTNTADNIANNFTGNGLLKLQFAANTAARNTTMPNVSGFSGTIQLSALGATGDKWNIATSLGTVPASLILDGGTTLFLSSGGASNFAGGITLGGNGNSENRGTIRIAGAGTALGGNISVLANSLISGENVGAAITGNISSGAAGTQTLTLGGTGSAGALLSGVIGGGTGTLNLATAVGGVYTLTNVNTYTGTTTVGAASTLQLGDGTTGNDGTIAGSTGIANAGTLIYNRFGSVSSNVPISGNGVVNKIGPGTQTLTSSNLTYTGATNVTSGTLTFDAASVYNLGGASGAFTVNGASAVLNLNGTFTVPEGNANAQFIVQGGGVLNSAGTTTIGNVATGAGIRIGDGSAGTLNVTAGLFNYTTIASSNLVVGRTSGGNGTVNVTGGTLTVNGPGGIIIANDTTTTGTINIGGTGTFVANTANFRFGNNATATSATVNLNTGGTLVLGVSPTTNAVSSVMNFDGGTLRASATLALPGTLTAANVKDGGAIFDTNGNTITVNPALLHFAGATTDGLTKNGAGTLVLAANNTYTGATLINTGTLQIGSGSTTGSISTTSGVTNNAALAYNRSDALSVGYAISGPGTVSQLGAGTTTFTGANSYAGGTTISAGTLQVGTGGTVGSGNVTNNATFDVARAGLTTAAIDGTGATSVTTAGATLTANHVRQSTVNIGAGNTVTIASNGGNSGTSVVTNLSINATGKLDLNDNDLIVPNGNLTSLTAQLATGLDINGSYGNGPGITSSAFANNMDFNTVLGIAANSDLGYTSFSGQTVGNNDVLIKYTYYGDADLSGSVDTSTDFDLYITGLTSGGSLGGWLFGDFDYSGTVDSSTDFDLYITGLTSQGAPLLTAGGGGGNLVQAVPEPSTLVLGGLALLGFAGVGLRRRRMASQTA